MEDRSWAERNFQATSEAISVDGVEKWETSACLGN